MIRIRLLSSPKPKWSHPGIEFDPGLPLDEADGLFVWGGMKPEFLEYRGIKAWFIDEPRTQSMFRLLVYRRALNQIEPHEFLHHSNPDPEYRFQCVTHYGELTRADSPDRGDGTVAVVSNYGGRLWRVRDYVFGAIAGFHEACPHRGVSLRNKIILQPDVELFGNAEVWSRFRPWPWSKPGAPPNTAARCPVRGSPSITWVRWPGTERLCVLKMRRFRITSRRSL